MTDHIKEVAGRSSVRVVAIVGGMAPEKQQRLLSRKPELVVATPGRLWELISQGEDHLQTLGGLARSRTRARTRPPRPPAHSVRAAPLCPGARRRSASRSVPNDAAKGFLFPR